MNQRFEMRYMDATNDECIILTIHKHFDVMTELLPFEGIHNTIIKLHTWAVTLIEITELTQTDN